MPSYPAFYGAAANDDNWNHMVVRPSTMGFGDTCECDSLFDRAHRTRWGCAWWGVINTGAHVGAHSIVNSAAVVEHDVRLGEFVHVGPGSALGGGTTVGQESYLGIGCRIRDHIALGNRTFVGMGAVVTKSFSDNARLVGVPARNLLAIPPRASQKLK